MNQQVYFLNGNIKKDLGNSQDVKFCMANNLLSVGYKSPVQVEVLEVAQYSKSLKLEKLDDFNKYKI